MDLKDSLFARLMAPVYTAPTYGDLLKLKNIEEYTVLLAADAGDDPEVKQICKELSQRLQRRLSYDEQHCSASYLFEHGKLHLINYNTGEEIDDELAQQYLRIKNEEKAE